MSEVRLRRGDQSDEPFLLGMFDEAVAWLAARGRTGQWGEKPWSTEPRRVRQVRSTVGEGDLWIAEIGGRAVGGIVLGPHPPPHVPESEESEVYVHLLITSRRFAGLGVGSHLLAHAREHAARQGISLLRVDCWGGGDRRLVEYYRGAGFTPTVTFDRNGWSGQVLQLRLD